MSNRLDVEMAARGLARSRSVATDLIKRGEVSVNGKAVSKASFEVSPTDAIEVKNPLRFVSRAGNKLDAALSAWDVSVEGLSVLDIGSSTGGFTDCLLKRGAAKVVAVDVGTDQMEAALRQDSRVELHENRDIRKFSAAEPFPLVVIDVSFISLVHVLPKAFELLAKKGKAVALVKPQFEVGRELAQKRRGVIRDEAERKATLEAVKAEAMKIGFKAVADVESSIEGEGGNREYLLLLEKK